MIDFEQSLWRFGTSGTLIMFYGIADHVARHRERGVAKVPAPKWLRPFVVVVITAFYLLIGPTGHALWGGIGNLAGIGAVLLAMGMRLSRIVRYPDFAGRALFYLALPFAVGVPWGLAVLSLPALAVSFYCAHRADQIAQATSGVTPAAKAYRMVPGIW